MRVIGIIAEFNPFHKGHEYLIERAREAVGDPRAIVMTVMSGPFVQRGTPSILPKNIRAKQALKSGADLVIEIPFTFACAPSRHSTEQVSLRISHSASTAKTLISSGLYLRSSPMTRL